MFRYLGVAFLSNSLSGGAESVGWADPFVPVLQTIVKGSVNARVCPIPKIDEYFGDLQRCAAQFHLYSYLPLTDVFGVLVNDFHDAGLSVPPLKQGGLKLWCGGTTTGGEDAFAVGKNFFAVADGVGGSTVSSSPLSKGLVDGALKAFQDDDDSKSRDAIELAKLIIRKARIYADGKERSFLKNMANKYGIDTDERGSSTFSFGFLDANKKDLVVANVGDSGVLVYRQTAGSGYRRRVVLETEQAQHYFNCPVQFHGAIGRVKSGSGLPVGHDDTSITDYYTFPLVEGDLIIATTDGCLDNVYDHELDEIISRAVSPYDSKLLFLRSLIPENNLSQSLQLPKWNKKSQLNMYTTPPGIMSNIVALIARWMSAERNTPSPFVMGGVYQGKDSYLSMRGKPDDVTAIVCWVVPESDVLPTNTTSQQQRHTKPVSYGGRSAHQTALGA